MGTWHALTSEEELRRRGRLVQRVEGVPVALFVADGQVYAVDNRCPHEGYPLVQGDLQDCVLTCLWHNYKFDVRDGSCLKGEEAVDAFPVEVRAGQVFVELPEPDPVAARSRRWPSLAQGMWENRPGQVGRDTIRLLELGVPPAELAAWTAAWDGDHSEWGASHTLPVAADAVNLAERYPGPQFARLLIQAQELTSQANQRRPPRARPAPEDPGADPVAAGALLAERIEAEDAAGAEALVRGALARGWGRETLEAWLWQPVCAHFLSFGHRLIYQSKVFDLLDAAGWAHADAVLGGHVLGIVNGTREDLLPPFAGFNKRLATVDLDATWAAVGTQADWDDVEALEAAITHGQPAASFSAVQRALEAGAPLQRVLDAIVGASCERLLRFDPAIDLSNAVQDGWLSVTHCLTSASAARVAVQRHQHPDVLRVVHHVARMANHHRTLDGERATLPEATEGDLVAAVLAKDTAGALAIAQTLSVEAVTDALLEVSTSDALAVPIVSAHALKTAVVALDEQARTQDDRPVWAVVRWLASPGRQRWSRRRIEEGMRFVLEGKIPKLLAP